MAVRRIGGLDNRRFWNEVLEADKYLGRLMFSKLEVYPFVGDEWADMSIPTLVFLGSYGRYLLRHGLTARVDISMVDTAVLGETLSPIMPESNIMGIFYSRDRFIKSVKALMLYPQLGMLTTASRDVWLEEIQRLRANPNHPESLLKDRLRRDGDNPRPGYDFPLAGSWPEAENDVKQLRMDVDQAMTILQLMTLLVNPRYKRKGIDLISTIIVSVVKRGNVVTMN